MIEIRKFSGFVVKASFEEFRELAELLKRDPVVLEAPSGEILVLDGEAGKLLKKLNLVEEGEE